MKTQNINSKISNVTFYIWNRYYISGGPENLHQLCNMLTNFGYTAAIMYENKMNTNPSIYNNYNNNVIINADIHDGDVIIIPECENLVDKQIDNRFTNIRTGKKIWFWLSIDNSPNIKANNDIKSMLEQSNVYANITQSYYAYDYLKKIGASNVLMVSDYINKDFLTNIPTSIDHKKRQVLYSPKRGYNFTKKIIEMNPDIKFIPLTQKTRTEMIQLMDESQLYIDFGHHPGKDRMPREAAIRNCMVMTSRLGSAGNDIDVGIPENYKFTSNDESLEKISKSIHYALDNYLNEIHKFEKYRETIRNEYNTMKQQVENFIQFCTK